MSEEHADLLTRAEVAKLLRVSKRTLSNWCRCGRIRCLRLSPRCVRFRRADVAEFMAGRKP